MEGDRDHGFGASITAEPQISGRLLAAQVTRLESQISSCGERQIVMLDMTTNVSGDYPKTGRVYSGSLKCRGYILASPYSPDGCMHT